VRHHCGRRSEEGWWRLALLIWSFCSIENRGQGDISWKNVFVLDVFKNIPELFFQGCILYVISFIMLQKILFEESDQ
jgi:hypothetical protein